jgi:hypothetical protein
MGHAHGLAGARPYCPLDADGDGSRLWRRPARPSRPLMPTPGTAWRWQAPTQMCTSWRARPAGRPPSCRPSKPDVTSPTGPSALCRVTLLPAPARWRMQRAPSLTDPAGGSGDPRRAGRRRQPPRPGLPSPTGKLWRSCGFHRQVLQPAYRAARIAGLARSRDLDLAQPAARVLHHGQFVHLGTSTPPAFPAWPGTPTTASPSTFRELRPVITTGAEVMDQIFRPKQRPGNSANGLSA